MLSKNEVKYYSSLLRKKFRDTENKFLVEGIKIVNEGLLSEFECEIIFVSKQFNEENKKIISDFQKEKIRFEIIPNSDFLKLIDTVNPQGIAAVFGKLDLKRKIESDLVVCLDNISDPGNLGTIIRNCDWFGIRELVLINHCADPYNPKAIRSSMGSIFHLNIFDKIDFELVFNKLKSAEYDIIYTDTKGQNIAEYSAYGKTIVVFSNEANGPSENIKSISQKKVTIPKIGNAESLNVASASAVILHQLTRISIEK